MPIIGVFFPLLERKEGNVNRERRHHEDTMRKQKNKVL